MFIKSQSNETIINLDRVCSIQKGYYTCDKQPCIKFWYGGMDGDFDIWKYDSIEERDKDFEKIQELLNVVEILNKINMKNQWQPIETCPEGVRVFVWLKSTTNKEYVGQRIEAIKMQNKYGWDCHELWVLEDLMAKNKYFSHWMPLPKPPVIKTYYKNLTKK